MENASAECIRKAIELFIQNREKVEVAKQLEPAFSGGLNHLGKPRV